jgi:hypothetical protein
VSLKQVVSDWNVFVVPAAVASLVATDEQHTSSKWVEGEQDSVGPLAVFRTKLFHVREL